MALITLRRVIAAATLCTVTFLGANGALAGTQAIIYEDVLKPNGHARTTAEKDADFRACGYVPGTFTPGT